MKFITEKLLRKVMLMIAEIAVLFICFNALYSEPTIKTFIVVFFLAIIFTAGIGYILIKDKTI